MHIMFIQNYKDVVNNTLVNKLRENMSNIAIMFNSLTTKKAISNRESDLYEKYKLQYSNDITSLQILRNNAQAIADEINTVLFKLSLDTVNHFNEDDIDEELKERILQK